MRRFLVPLFWLGALMLCPSMHAQDADTGEPPIYREFRVLSGLPWKEAGATRKTVLERIFREPDALVRNEVLLEYLQKVLPLDQFPAAFDECIALEQADFPGAPPELVMRAWAERDPLEAIKRCQTLFDLVIEGAPLEFDAWSRPIRIGDLEKVRASKYWFGDRGVVHAFWKGMAASLLFPERRTEMEAKFATTYDQRFHEKLPEDVEEPTQVWARRHQSSYSNPPPTISSDPGLRAEFLRLLATPPEEIPGMLKWPREPWNDLLFSRALVRWMDGDAKKAPQIVERVLEAYDPRRYYREDERLMDVIPTEFLVEWAIADRNGFLAWAENRAPSCGWRAQAVCLAVMSKEKEVDVHARAWDPRSQAAKSERDNLWIHLDPHDALPRVYQYGNENEVDAALDALLRSDPPANYWRRVVVPFNGLGRRSSGGEAWRVTEVWGPVDFRAMIKHYGLPWCLHSGEVKASQVPGMFANREALDHSALRSTLSALRTWATVRPKEMRAWIDGEKFSPSLRESLLWVLDNAGGGFAVPAPAEPR